MSLLRLFEKVTNGTVIEISYTGTPAEAHYYPMLMDRRAGTSVLLKPGIISGGPVSHDCPLSRSVGYYMEPMLAIAPFAKKALLLTLRGVTTNDEDLSVSLGKIFGGSNVIYDSRVAFDRLISSALYRSLTSNYSAFQTGLS